MKLMRVITTFFFGFVLTGSIPAHAAGADNDTHYEALEMISPAAGKEAEFGKWYAKHISAVLKVSGVHAVQRWHGVQAMREGNAYPSNILKISLDTKNLDAAVDKLGNLRKEGGDLLGTNLSITAVYHPLEKIMAKDIPGTASATPIEGKTKPITFELLAFVGFQPGHEDEFNKGYNEQHFPDVMRNPGTVWGQREKLVRVDPEDTVLPGYVAVYEFQAYDIVASNDEVNARLKDHRTRGIPFSGGKGGMGIYAVPVP